MNKTYEPPKTLKELNKSMARGARVQAEMWKGVSPKRRKEIQAETRAVFAWWLRPIGVGQGEREAPIRERLLLYHTRYCLRKYPIWDLLAFWAKWSQNGNRPDSAVGDLCRWLDMELDRLDFNRGFREANVSATIMVVLILMREHFRANAAPSFPAWDEQSERAEMLIARATRAKAEAEARAAGEDVPHEHPAIARLFDPRQECPPAFYVEPAPKNRRAVRRGHA